MVSNEFVDFHFHFLNPCKEFGKIIEIKNCRAGSLKGQAWIVFKDITSATEAINRRQGFNFYGNPLVSVIDLIAASSIHSINPDKLINFSNLNHE